MNDHVSDDDLVLLYYGEDGHVRPQAANHVSGCAECTGRLAELRAQLKTVEPPAAPAREADYGARVYARLLPRLQQPRKRSLAPVAGFLAIAASLAFAFWLGRQFPEPDRALSADVRERILLVAVGDHLDRSQMVLVELATAPVDEPLDVRTQQASAGDLVSANRLYRQTAARSGDTALLAVLEELERLLVEVAAGPETLGRDDLAELQRRIESRGLLFKVRVVGSQVRAREKAPASPLRNVS